ncbi:MAG: MFS transporter [Candidatus Micrarchaeota archaeon]|nr:MFS transporter [Candidatus Micrarchaeota archaeon]MDE1834167.1 MFS transporter [Candidatus Micrarchaeota archaeon]MDE1858976.1 MFS transporter [Candidatus Micrarchaeota archaeon]
MKAPRWMNREVLLISFSAFFADLGYQTVIALFPILLVLVLGASPSTYGIATALAFGVGSVFGYIGGILGDRFSYKKIAILGNLFVPLLSLVGLAVSPTVAIVLFASGWWARNFRSPPRRSMLVLASTQKDRGKAFGFLHALDIGGGMLSILILAVVLLSGISYRTAILITALPILFSTVLLLFARDPSHEHIVRRSTSGSGIVNGNAARSAYLGILVATLLYGFSYYSLGFPILTIAEKSSSIAGIGSYAVYLGVSAVAGYYIGSRKLNKIKVLGTMGYILSGIGTLGLGFAYILGQGTAVFYLMVAVIGLSLGVIETLEPTIVSLIKVRGKVGSGMGALTASRSFGVFAANLIMGFLYMVNPFYSYTYAGLVSVAAGCIIMYYGKGFSKR